MESVRSLQSQLPIPQRSRQDPNGSFLLGSQQVRCRHLHLPRHVSGKVRVLEQNRTAGEGRAGARNRTGAETRTDGTGQIQARCV